MQRDTAHGHAHSNKISLPHTENTCLTRPIFRFSSSLPAHAFSADKPFMRSWTRIAGFVVLAVSAVYTVSAGGADFDGSSAPPQSQADPFATPLASSQTVTVADDSSVFSAGDQTASKSVVSNADGTYGFHFPNNSNIIDVLQKIAATGQISIIPSKDVRGTLPAIDLYNVTIPDALGAILNTNGFAYEQRDGIIYVYSDKELTEREKLDLVTDIYHLYYIRSTDALAIIKPALSPEAQTSISPASKTGIDNDSSSSSDSSSITSTGTASSSSSTGSSSADTGGDDYADDEVLVVTDHPRNQQQVRDILAQIDQKPKEVLIEATILSAELQDNNSLGIDFSALGGVSLNSLAFPPSTGGLQASQGNLQTTPAGTTATGNGVTGYTAANSGAGGLQIGVVYSNLAVFLNALESVTNTTILANPKVLTLDKQPGYVHVGETLYYYNTTVTQNAQTQAAQPLDTGITLTLRPFVEANGAIRMEIHPINSTGQILPTGLPQTDNTEVSTNVIIQDGRTIVIGGLFTENSSINKTQTPLLADIPVIGALFKQQQDTTDRREIIFLITPHIVSDDQALANVSKEALRDIELLRVGVRQGMMFFSSERLAESCYEDAQAELQKPHPDLNLVRWHLDCATNLNPTFLEALKLKEQVTGKELSASDNSNIRGFITREMLEEQRLRGNLPPVPADPSAAASNAPLSLPGN